jgi:hypothetical protein
VPKPPPLRAIGNLRVSTAEQASSGLGLDAQRSAISAACQQRGWGLPGFEEDAGVSSVARRRPGLETALAAVHTGEADAIVVSKLDRLARSTLQAATLLADAAKNNWELIIADVDASTAGGRFMRNVMAAAAEYEHELIAAAPATRSLQPVLAGCSSADLATSNPMLKTASSCSANGAGCLLGPSQSDSSPLKSSAPAAANDGTGPPSPGSSSGTASASTGAGHATRGSSSSNTGHRDRTHQTRATESAQEARKGGCSALRHSRSRQRTTRRDGVRPR